VIYMRDGIIVADEAKAIGRMAKGARRIYFRRRKTTDQDIVAGVSALMHDVPGKEITDLPKRRKLRHRSSKLLKRLGRRAITR